MGYLTFILIIINIFVFSFNFFDSSQKNLSIQKNEIRKQQIENIDFFSISNFEGQQKSFFKKEKGEWKQQLPFEGRVNQEVFIQFLAQLETFPQLFHFPVEDNELEDYGLKNPSFIISLGNKDFLDTYAFSSLNLFNKKTYALDLKKKMVFVLPQEFRNALWENIPPWIDRQIVQELLPDEIQSIDFKDKKNNKTFLLRKKEVIWEIESPIATQAETKAVQELVENIFSLKYKNWHKSDFEFPETEAFQWTLQDIYHKTVSFSLWKREDQFYVKNDLLPYPILLENPNESLCSISVHQLRKQILISLDLKKLSRCEIRCQDRGVILFQLETGDWKVQKLDSAPLHYPAEPTIVEDLITYLAQLKAKSFPFDKPDDQEFKFCELDNPRRIIQLTADKNEEITLSGSDNSKLYLKLFSQPFIYEVDPSILSKFSLDVLHYRQRNLFTLPEFSLILSAKIIDLENKKILWEVNQQSSKELLSKVRNLFAPLCVKKFCSDICFPQKLNLDKTTQLPWNFKLELQYGSDPSSPSTSHTLILFFTKIGNLLYGGSEDFSCTFEASLSWTAFLEGAIN